MARLARSVASALPHHVTQRGNRRRPTFSNEGDYVRYRSLRAEQARAAGIQKSAAARNSRSAVDAPDRRRIQA